MKFKRIAITSAVLGIGVVSLLAFQFIVNKSMIGTKNAVACGGVKAVSKCISDKMGDSADIVETVEAYIEELKILTKEEFMAELNITEEFYDVDRMYQDFVDEMNISVKNGTLAEEQPQIVTIFADMKGDYLKEEVTEEMDAEAGVSNVTEEEQPVGTQTELTLDDLVQIGTENGEPVYITKEDYNLIYGSASSGSGGGSIEDDRIRTPEEAAAAQAEYNKADGWDPSGGVTVHEYTDIEKEILGNLH